MTPARYAPVPDWPHYRCGSDGGVWSDYSGEWKRLKPRTSNQGHPYVMLSDKPLPKRRVAVHTLVLEAFVGPRPPGLEAHHSPDPDKSNCAIGNLCWAVPAVVVAAAVGRGLYRGSRGRRTKLCEEGVREIRASGETGPVLAARFGIVLQTVYKIRSRQRWDWLE